MTFLKAWSANGFTWFGHSAGHGPLILSISDKSLGDFTAVAYCQIIF